MENWDDLKYLLAVKKTGTMVAAASLLGANVATVSRRIDRLGQEIGAPLFMKSAGQWQLNPDAKGLLEVAEEFEGCLMTELSRILSQKSVPSATSIRIGAPPFINTSVLTPGIREALERQPSQAIELHDRANGAGLGDMDILLRAGQPENGRLITRRIGALSFRLYRHKKGLGDQSWAGLTEEFNDYAPMRYALDYFSCKPILKATQIAQLYHLAKSTYVTAPLPELLVREDDNFIPLEPEKDPVSVEIWLAYHASRKSDAAIQSTVNWVSWCFQRTSSINTP